MSEFRTIDLQPGGKEIALGGVADSDTTGRPNGLLSCEMDANFKSELIAEDKSDDNINNFVGTISGGPKTVATYIVETGTSEGWEYYRYSNGMIDAYKRATVTLTNYATWNNMYAYTYTTNLPFTMKDTNYFVFHNWIVGSGHALTGTANYSVNTTTSVGVYCVSSSSGSQTCKITLHLHGYPANILKFSVDFGGGDIDIFNFISEMTWNDWILSDYNTEGANFTIIDNEIWYSGDSSHAVIDSVIADVVRPSDLIVAERRYELE